MEALCQLAAADPRIVLLTGDLGFMALEPFRDRYRERFFNAGVAEQSMIGLATGLAEAGLRPYVYSIATFASLRALEFIRNGPVRHRLPVRIVGMGAGFEYGCGGSTHHAVEDISVLRALPGLGIVIPADACQAAAALRATHELPGPFYYSLGKDDRSSVPGLNGRFDLGHIQVIRNGCDVALIAMGAIVAEALAATDELAGMGIQAAVALVSNFCPDPGAELAELLSGFRHAVSVEAQTVSGGLGAFTAGVIASLGLPCRLRMLAVRSAPDGTSGSQPDRWRKHGLDRSAIVAAAVSAVRGER